MKILFNAFKKKGEIMEQKNYSNDMPEEVLLVPKPRRIQINCTLPIRAYTLFDTKTGVQVKDFVKCNGGGIVFDDLDPNKHYDVGVVEGMGDEKPQFAIAWTRPMRDETDEILGNSDGLPIEYPERYLIKYKDDNSNGVYDLVDDSGDVVGQVSKLSPQGDKPRFVMVCTFKMKDDTIK